MNRGRRRISICGIRGRANGIDELDPTLVCNEQGACDLLREIELEERTRVDKPFSQGLPAHRNEQRMRFSPSCWSRRFEYRASRSGYRQQVSLGFEAEPVAPLAPVCVMVKVVHFPSSFCPPVVVGVAVAL